MPSRVFDRLRGARRIAARIAGVTLCVALLGACDDDGQWHTTDVSGALPPLHFTMTRTSDGKQVTADDYRRRIALLYFGYTFCPDVCPTTLSNLSDVLKQLGPAADHVRVLFVTVDPDRDKAPVLTEYVRNFSPLIDGLRGTEDQIAALARRYRVAYSVTPATKGHPYEVTHSSAIYVFDGSGKIRLLVSSLSTAKPDIAGTVSDLRRLIDETDPPGLIDRMMRLL